MRRASASGRDKPHSSLAALPRGSARNGVAAPWSLAPTLGLGLVLAALQVAVSPLPAAPWTGAEHPGVSLGWLWDALLLALPVGERGVRGELAALLLILALATAAGLLCARLYRGTGRDLAAATSVPLTTALLLAWLRIGPVGAVTTLASSLAATLALASLLGARGWLDRSSWIRGGAALLGVVLLAPRFGCGLAALLLAHAGWQRARGRWFGVALVLAVLLAVGTCLGAGRGGGGAAGSRGGWAGDDRVARQPGDDL